MHPKCWCVENFRKIGDLWGKTIQVEHVFVGVNSITSAKILVRTAIKKRIDTNVKVEWESGECVMWVSEVNESRNYGVLDKQGVVELKNGASEQTIGGVAQWAGFGNAEVVLNVDHNEHMIMGQNLMEKNDADETGLLSGGDAGVEVPIDTQVLSTQGRRMERIEGADAVKKGVNVHEREIQADESLM
ncbi:unnamed protein product [Amaranthus hypochondriacus]